MYLSVKNSFIENSNNALIGSQKYKYQLEY